MSTIECPLILQGTCIFCLILIEKRNQRHDTRGRGNLTKVWFKGRNCLKIFYVMWEIFFDWEKFYIFYIFCWPCISLQILANDQIDALFRVFIYFISLHVSSITVLIIRRSNFIYASSGMISLCEWLLGMLVRRGLQLPPDRHSKQSFTQTNHSRCINTIWSPDDEH